MPRDIELGSRRRSNSALFVFRKSPHPVNAKISRVEAFVVSQKLERVFAFSQWRYAQRSVCLVRVTTESGHYGWGEGYGPAEVVRSGIEFFAPLLTGGDPLQTGTLWQRMHLRALDFTRRGVLLAALSAIDIALWDLKGKLLGVPVHVLLGGRRVDAVPVYATGLYFDEQPGLTQRLAAEALGYVPGDATQVTACVGRSP